MPFASLIHENVDVSGKIIFTDLPPASVQAQARERGAIGVISDCICPPWLADHPPVRDPEDAPDLEGAPNGWWQIRYILRFVVISDVVHGTI